MKNTFPHPTPSPIPERQYIEQLLFLDLLLSNFLTLNNMFEQ